MNTKIKYGILIGIISIVFIAELVVGIIANSATLQTDAFHMLSDLVAHIIGFFALHVRHNTHHRYTYGWARAEVIAGLVNSVFLLAVCFMISIENIEKFIELSQEPENDSLEENIDLVLIVAGIGLAVNIIGLLLFHDEHHHHSHSEESAETSASERTSSEAGASYSSSLSEKIINYSQLAVILHIIGDAAGSILVLIASVCIKYGNGGWRFFLDPIGSVVIIIFIIFSSIKLAKECIKILMHSWQGTPPEEIKTEVLSLPGVQSLHDFHVWDLDNTKSIATMHIQVEDELAGSAIDDIKIILHSHGIHSSTIQPEKGSECNEPVCDSKCNGKKCC